MSTPVKRPDATPAVPAATAGPLEPVPLLAPLGWILMVVAGLGLALATWVLYPTDATGMWAGYRDEFIATIVLICAMWLRTSLPAKPALAVVGLCGILLILFAVFLDDTTKIFVSELAAGIGMLAGTVLYVAGSRD